MEGDAPLSLTDQIYIKAKEYGTSDAPERKKAAVDEGIVPEFIGIVNYCAIALIQLSSGIGNTIPAEEALQTL